MLFSPGGLSRAKNAVHPPVPPSHSLHSNGPHARRFSERGCRPSGITTSAPRSCGEAGADRRDRAELREHRSSSARSDAADRGVGVIRNSREQSRSRVPSGRRGPRGLTVTTPNGSPRSRSSPRDRASASSTGRSAAPYRPPPRLRPVRVGVQPDPRRRVRHQLHRPVDPRHRPARCCRASPVTRSSMGPLAATRGDSDCRALDPHPPRAGDQFGNTPARLPPGQPRTGE